MTILDHNTDFPWIADPALGSVPASFSFVSNKLLIPAGCVIDDVHREIESAEYGAVKFTLNGKAVLYRQAKTTPKKMGQFVTIWKREAPGSEIAPFDLKDGVDWVIVAADEGAKFGVFVFSANLLAKKGIFSDCSEGGKRAIRVYAPWTIPTSGQAQRTKKWQSEHFLSFDKYDAALTGFAKMLN